MPSYTQEEREQALIRLMQTYGDSVKRLCCMYLRELGAAEDAAQDTFIKAFSHIDALLAGDVRNEKAWIMRIAINTCKDLLRSSWLRRFDRRRSIDELPLSALPDHEDNLALMQAVCALPPNLKELVLLHYYQDFNLRTCAHILGISSATASRRLQQAQQKLRHELERS
ncbi:MAG: sigma-70 family RNA polymerase sigma factor [Clostridia bacterium]|nr:sigma-70 family RNA polymerase sigma factor [Clostridia bacterium]